MCPTSRKDGEKWGTRLFEEVRAMRKLMVAPGMKARDGKRVTSVTWVRVRREYPAVQLRQP